MAHKGPIAPNPVLAADVGVMIGILASVEAMSLAGETSAPNRRRESPTA
jgi:hypothetical protein